MPSYGEQTVDIEITGIKGARAITNTQLNVEMIDENEMDGSDRYKQLVSKAIDKGLRVFGYYNSSVSFELKPRQGKRDLLIANVTPGDPSRIASVEVKIQGEASADEEFALLTQKQPQQGDLVEHKIYDDYKSSLSKLALNRGYFDADFLVSQLEISPETHQGWWRIWFNSGVRYHYGEIRFIGSQIREDYLRNMLNIQSGQPYNIDDVSKLTANFSSPNWFNSVLLQPRIREQEKLVDLAVFLRPRKKNLMELGVGYATDSGIHGTINWTRPWINGRGHNFNTDMYISSPKQTISAKYHMPLLKNPLNYYYEISTGYEREKETSTDTDTKALTLGALRYWNHENTWQFFAGLRLRYDDYIQADYQNNSLLIYPTIGLSRSRFRGGTFPSWGDSQSITIDYGNRIWQSDVNFFKIQAYSAWVRTLNDNHRFLTRLELGYLNTADINNIPPTLRFFAGGDRSVRGYGYKKISPKNSQDQFVGGSRLAAGSIEYQYQVYPAWWLATFADAGFAADSFGANQLRYGAGVGVRWASPVGAIKFDLATPIRDRDDSKNIQFYIGLGTEI